MKEKQNEYERTLSGWLKRSEERDAKLKSSIEKLDADDPSYWSKRHQLEAENYVANEIDLKTFDGEETNFQKHIFSFCTSTNRFALQTKLDSSMILTRLVCLERKIQEIHNYAKYSFLLLLLIACTAVANYYGIN